MGAIPLIVVIIATVAALALRGSRWDALALRISRWTYAIVFPLSLLYFPLRTGFHFRTLRCEWTFDAPLAVYSLRNYPHLIGFALFFLLTWAQLRNVPIAKALLLSIAACALMGFLVEIAEGMTGIHHCRMRDLVPDTAGGIVITALVLSGLGIRRRARTS